MRRAIASTSIDILLNAVCAAAGAKGINLENLRHALCGRDLAGRPPKRDSRTVLALLENGWDDLTMICDISDDGNVEQRLMCDPAGAFHIVAEHFDPANDVWETKSEEVSPAQARRFYVSHAMPESLASGFAEYESPSLQLDSALRETEAVMTLLATFSTDAPIHGCTTNSRLKIGLDQLVRRTCARARDAHEAL